VEQIAEASKSWHDASTVHFGSNLKAVSLPMIEPNAAGIEGAGGCRFAICRRLIPPDWVQGGGGSMKIFSPLRRDFSVPPELASRWTMLDELGLVLEGTFKEFEPDFHILRANSCDDVIPRSWQNAATLCPLASCSDTIPRHFAHNSAPRSLMPTK
jgi:hypothetical protein